MTGGDADAAGRQAGLRPAMIRMRDLLGSRLGGLAEGPGFQALFDGLPEAAALLDDRLCLRQANPALRLALGPAQPARPGQPAARLFDAACRPAAQSWLEGGADPGELRLSAPEGMQGMPVRPHRIALPEGASLLLLQDRTESHALAEAMAEGDRLQALGTLAGGIAHDFNNLLGVVLGATEDARGLLGPEQGAALAELDQVRQAAQRGAALVKQLLAYAQQQVLAPQLVPLNEAVRNIIPMLRSGLGGRIQLDLALEEPGRSVRIDPSQLDRVLMNLAMNACQAMPQGGRLRLSTGRLLLLKPLTLGLEEVPAGRWTVLEVADTGAGIPPEMLPRIFDPFFTGRGPQGGTGMGLATVKGIVRQSGGHVLVESQPGQGTCFRILLPRVEEAEAPPPPRATPIIVPPLALAEGQAGRGPLLLVEDEPPLLRLAERALRRAGWQVTAAEDAESALTLVEGGLRPAMLVSDVVMPGLDGAALSQRLRRRFPGLPVLLVSGYAPSLVDGGLPGEVSRFLAKPYAPAELVRSVAEIAPVA